MYRRDEIDATHFPVFHQVEGVHIFPKDDGLSSGPNVVYDKASEFIVEHMVPLLQY